MAKCPCHDDRTQSLSIDVKPGRDGRRRIYIHDHAGCPSDAILRYLGIHGWDEVLLEPDPNWKPGGKNGNGTGRNGAGNGAGTGNGSGSGRGKNVKTTKVGGVTVHTVGGDGADIWHKVDQGRRKRAGNTDGEDGNEMERNGAVGADRAGGAAGDPGRAGNRGSGMESGGGRPVETAGDAGAAVPEPEKALEIDWAHPDREYSYTDENGIELFQVVRFHYLNGPGKSFRQRMYRPGDPGAKRDGWVYKVPESLRDCTLYRMPKVLAAVRSGEPVYVVEGEKDVETLERLGYTATCNPGGAGKWRDGYSRILEGADLIILPDNDPRNDKGGYPGQDHALQVAMMTRGWVKRSRIVNLKEACPDLPPKGDISDLVAIMGDVDGIDALQRQIAATRDFDPEMVPFWLTPEEQAERLYAQVSGYGVVDGCIVQYAGDGATKPLCDFVVIPREEKILDDGVSQQRMFVLDGWNSAGRKLARVNVSGQDLDGMGWVTGKWGFQASIVPGSTTKAKVAWCIKKVGQMVSKEVTEYNHTGWRKIGGEWCYLFHGGAIGAQGITVNMGAELNTYRLDGSGNPKFHEMGYAEAARKTLSLMNVTKRSTAIALLGTVFLAPLREWMTQTDVVPAFSLFLHGQTQTRKSSIAALAMAHFGNFHAKNAPANFNSTGNSIARKAFACKDMPFWVDDFHPTDSQQEKRAMNATAQRLARAFGDGADRGRLNADGSLQVNRPPRSVAIITGEDLPAVGASGLARFFIVDVEKGDIPVTEELTALQEDAREGWLQRSMRGYILFLEKQTKTLPTTVHDLFMQFRENARKIGSGDQERAPEAIACIMTGYVMLLRYCESLGVFDETECQVMAVEALKSLTEASRKQSRDMESEKPSRIFLDTLSELISTRRVWVKDLVIGEQKGPFATDNMIGWRDNSYFYLLPNMAFKEVSRVCREEGHEFPVSLKALYKHLKADGLITVKEGENPTKTKNIEGKVKRVLWLPAKVFDGESIPGQTEMDATPEYTVVHGAIDLPWGETKDKGSN